MFTDDPTLKTSGNSIQEEIQHKPSDISDNVNKWCTHYSMILIAQKTKQICKYYLEQLKQQTHTNQIFTSEIKQKDISNNEKILNVHGDKHRKRKTQVEKVLNICKSQLYLLLRTNK